MTSSTFSMKCSQCINNIQCVLIIESVNQVLYNADYVPILISKSNAHLPLADLCL